jgi:hypothetical protein
MGMHPRKILWFVPVFLLLAACGAGSSTTTAPTQPSAPPSTNQPPQIAEVTVTPSFVVAGVGTATAHVDARDPDGDRLTYTWITNQNQTTGPDAPDFSYQTPGTQPASVRVTDAKGESVRATLPGITWADMDNRPYFDGYFDDQPNGLFFLLETRRTGASITEARLLFLRSGKEGFLDPAQAGTLDAAGNFTIRIKMKSDEDLQLIGKLIPGKDPRFFEPTSFGFLGKGRIVGGQFDGRTFTFGNHQLF